MWQRTFLVAFVCLSLTAIAPRAAAQQYYRLVPQVIYEDRPVTASRWVTETNYETQRVTEYRGVWVDEPRERRISSMKPVKRDRILEERYSVQKPVTETSYEERTVEETYYEEVTEYQDQQFVIEKPIIETVYRDETVVVRKPVTQTVMQTENVVAYRPQTSTQTVYYQGTQQVVQPVVQPGYSTNGLRWLPRGYYYDPNLGQTVFRRAGFHWAQQQTPTTVNYQTSQVPVLIPQQSTQTVMVPEVVQQQRPVEISSYQDVVETRKVPVQVQRTERVVETRKVPVTVRKPVIRQRVEKVAVPPRYETQEVVRRVPFVETVYEPVEEVESYTVKVFKTVPEVREVQVPRQVVRRVDYQTTERVARTVMVKVPTDACGNPLPGPAQAINSNPQWSVVESTAVPGTGTSTQLAPIEYRARPVYSEGNGAIPEELRQYGNPILLERRVLDATPADGQVTPNEPLKQIEKPVVPADQAPQLPSGDDVDSKSRSVLENPTDEAAQGGEGSGTDPALNGTDAGDGTTL